MIQKKDLVYEKNSTHLNKIYKKHKYLSLKFATPRELLLGHNFRIENYRFQIYSATWERFIEQFLQPLGISCAI